MKVDGLEKAWLALSERAERSGMCHSEYISDWREYKAFKRQMRRFFTVNRRRGKCKGTDGNS